MWFPFSIYIFIVIFLFHYECRAYRERVEILKRKKMELKAAKSTMQRRSSELDGKDSSDQDSSSDDDSDDAVDWRAKHL